MHSHSTTTQGEGRSESFASAKINTCSSIHNDQPPPAAATAAAVAAAADAAAAAAAVPAAAGVDATLLVSDDLINMVATFASCRDLCVLGQVCRRFFPLPFHEDLWELRALDVLPGPRQLRSAMAELSLATSREVVETFTRIGIPGGVLGFWQAEPPSAASAAGAAAAAQMETETETERGPEPLRSFSCSSGEKLELEARGELLRIGLEAGGFVCESIAPSGVRRRIFTIRVSKTAAGRVKIGFFSQEREFSLTIGGGDDDWVPGDSMAEAKARYTFAVPGRTKRSPIRASGLRAFFLERENGRIGRYVKLTAPPLPPLSTPTPPPASASSPLSRDSSSSAMDCSTGAGAGGGGGGGEQQKQGAHQNLCGLWCAPYGSHGLEIIQLSMDSSCSPFDGAAAATAAAAIVECPPSGARSPSWSTASLGRMTDGSESACTSAPATEDGDGSKEDGFCSVEGSGSGRGSGSDAASGSDSGDGYGDVDCFRIATKRRRRRHRSDDLHRRQQQQQQQDQQPVSAAAADDGATLPSQLFGFKVTGDENVPAGKTSFVIDLSNGFAVDEELQADTRPVVMFLPSGAVMANLANRRDQISSWHKGRGQINRVPGRWLPEWVDVEFVAYRPGSRCAFSVIFRQPAQAVRVVMDFERAHGCEEGWPQWPAAAAAPAAAPGVGGAACGSAA